MKKTALALFLAAFALLLHACGGTVVTSSGTSTGFGNTGAGGSDAGMSQSFTISGTASGLMGKGLTIQNGSEALAINVNGAFAFKTPVASGATYDVTVATEPSMPTETCTVANGIGTATANVTNVTVTCATSGFTIGGTVIGLATNDSVVLQDNGSDDLAVSTDGPFTFATPVASGASFAVTVLAEPGAPVQTCTVSGGTGTIGGGNVTSVTLNCTTNKYTVGGTVSGLAGSGLVLQDNGADSLTITGNGTFSFATPIAGNATYDVTILTQPTSPSQTCVVTNGSGTVGAANVTTVTVTCTTNTCPAGTTSNCVLIQANSGSTETGTCAVGFTGSCSFSCSLGTWTQVTNTCVIATCSGVAGPTLTTNISGWPNSGIAFHALRTGTLQSFVFNNQGLADTVTLFDVTANATVATLATPAGNATYNPTVNWPLVSGHSYQISCANGSNGRWVIYSSFPVTDAQISVDATWGGTNGTQSAYWFTFTNLITCG